MTPSRGGRGAGPALDAEVSTLVMEKCPHAELRECSAEFSGEMDWWYECIACKETHSDRYWFEPTQYSTSIHNAFLVVEAMRAKGCSFDLSSYESYDPSRRWMALFDRVENSGRTMARFASTPALAICIAAIDETEMLAASSAKSAVPETETPVSPASL